MMGEKTKCQKGEKCKNEPPLLDEENRKYFELFTLCDSQIRVASMGGVIGLEWGIILQLADEEGIKRDNFFYRLLKIFEHTLCKEINRKEHGK